jgi:hypothetical protein
MEAASDRIIIERLQEEWNQPADDVVYRELELEKQLWMLSALNGFIKSPRKEINEGAYNTGTTKVLSLFESNGQYLNTHLNKTCS